MNKLSIEERVKRLEGTVYPSDDVELLFSARVFDLEQQSRKVCDELVDLHVAVGTLEGKSREDEAVSNAEFLADQLKIERGFSRTASTIAVWSLVINAVLGGWLAGWALKGGK